MASNRRPYSLYNELKGVLISLYNKYNILVMNKNLIIKMDFTPTQEKIIRQVCKIQSDSAIRLISNKMRVKDDNSYQAKHLQRLINEWNLSEIDLLDSFTNICEDFDNLNDNPSLLPHLGQSSLRIFKKIFTEYCFTWKDLYPNAHNNLDRKILSLLIRVDKSDTTINLNLN